MEKVFGEFKSNEDLNQTAKNLKENSEYDELLILGQENGIDKKRIKQYYDSFDEMLIENEQKCRICGCTENNACEDGCYWVEEDLCSKCVEKRQKDVSTDETAVEKLQRELQAAKNRIVPIEPIVNFLNKEYEQDAELGNFILLSHKTLDKCFSYVEKKAREKIKGSSGWIADDEVYSWAKEYYLLDDAAIEKAETEKREKEKEERIKREEEAEKNKPLETKTENIDKKVKKHKAKDDSQLSLFDFGGMDIE